MDAALRTCLDHGRTEIVREALEVGEMEESDWMFAVVGIGWVKPKPLKRLEHAGAGVPPTGCGPFSKNCLTGAAASRSAVSSKPVP